MNGKKITKADLVELVSLKAGFDRRDVKPVIDILLEEIKRVMVNSMTIELRGFGTFEVKVRKGKQKARNPKTGEPVSVPAHRVAVFRPGKELKRDVWVLTKKSSIDTISGSDV
ncbi:MAG: integration host factor subunit beta [Spirochaetaceae bacterium]|jgi:integration host factor subunit beta|nr:integration host factor subunit beta [Spirochaetaceae bacterium]